MGSENIIRQTFQMFMFIHHINVLGTVIGTRDIEVNKIYKTPALRELTESLRELDNKHISNPFNVPEGDGKGLGFRCSLEPSLLVTIDLAHLMAPAMKVA